MPITGAPPVTGRNKFPPSGMPMTGAPPVTGMMILGPMSCDGDASSAGDVSVVDSTAGAFVISPLPGAAPIVAHPAAEKSRIERMSVFMSFITC